VLFVYEDADDEAPSASRASRSVFSACWNTARGGPGYELDTRLRPSGSHGLLVVSLEAFARYRWSRRRAGAAGAGEGAGHRGDAQLGARVVAVAHAAAYEGGAPEPERMHHLRTRMERELTHERLDRRPRATT